MGLSLKSLRPILIFLLSAYGAAGQSSVKDQIVAAEKLLHSRFRENAPGVSALVARNGEIIFRGNVGLANLQTKAPIRSDTVFDIASLSKAFTATAILLLAEEGKLNVEDPLTRHLAEIRGYSPAITLHHLLNHTSGLPDFDEDEQRSGHQFTPEEIVAWHAKQKRLRFNPGVRYEYSNSGYVLLSVIVERVSGQAFPEFLRQRIFLPLKMSRTTLRVPVAKIENRATGYRSVEAGFRVSDSDGVTVQGDGGIQTCAEDLFRWAEAWHTGRLLKPQSAQAALAPAQLNDGKRVAYGFGWGLGKLDDRGMLAHDGTSRGFRSFLTLLFKPGENVTILVLANQREADPRGLGMELARIFLAKTKSAGPGF